MLFRLLIFRLAPLGSLYFCKERRQMKQMMILLLVCYGGCLAAAAWKIFLEEQWRGMFYLPLSMFPHYLCYGFAIWIMLRCLWCAWSVRVWRRIFCIAHVCVLLGILVENYWNPVILEIFLNIFE